MNCEYEYNACREKNSGGSYEHPDVVAGDRTCNSSDHS